MESNWIQELALWIADNAAWAGVIIALVAFAESLAVIGVIIPGILFLFALGAMVGLGALDFYNAWFWSTLGAIAGDALSYWLGYRYRSHIWDFWPFSRHPDMLVQGRNFIAKHGAKSIIIGRFVGPLRPLIPVVSGMLAMPPRRFFSFNIPACILWAPAYILPGVLFGASLDLAAEYATRLALVLGLIVATVWIAAWLLRMVYELLAARAARLLRHGVRWVRRHPHLGRLTRGIIDPRHPETLSIIAMGVFLFIAFWALLVALVISPSNQDPSDLDQTIRLIALGLRNHLADPLMLAFAELGQPRILLVATGVLLVWLWLRRRTLAAWHWLAAVAGGYVLQQSLVVALTATPVITDGQARYPSAALTLATTAFGFLAVMLARDLRRRRRRWPYLIAVIALLLLMLARLYLGLDWFTGALAGVLLGALWVLVIGIAYRQHANRRVRAGIAAGLFYGVFAVGLTASLVLSLPDTLRHTQLPLTERQMPVATWWQDGWQTLPQTRTPLTTVATRRFHLQWAAPRQRLEATLAQAGWRPADDASWRWLLRTLNPEPNAASLPLLAKDYLGRPETLVMIRGDEEAQTVLSLRFWDSGLRLGADGTPVWLGMLSQERIAPRARFFRHWRATPASEEAINGSLKSLPAQQLRQTDAGLWLIREIPAGSPPA